ncbi:juvenile hormone epoxide hydrolase 1-like [Anoplophora glabripennis]|uniref:juvenile hormone epoxide hydrolase 1-like n=1 Tax=Anoplophora glabripennis TaxID=217634 RepID=UPI000875205B|nr:juvenile hormone epoxide hydrolase 1-like [Anoplophora glabripennis]
MWGKILIVVLIAWLSASFFARVKNFFFSTPQLPLIKDELWWGPGKPYANEDTDIKPFTINVSQTVLTDLNWRLSQALPFQPALEGVQQQYGINTNHLRNIIDFWQTKYDWRQREKLLNIFPQYTTSIQGLKIHYIHVKPKVTKGVKVLPLFILHGWPSSAREFYDIIPLLTNPTGDFVFEVVAPSLPGYAFSAAAVRPGLNPMEIAVIFKNLMERLGFHRYYLHGGDWGSQVVAAMATLYPHKILGTHSNFCFVNTPLAHLKLMVGSFFPWLIVEDDIRDKVYPLSEKYMRWIEETGYMHIQATKPDTIGVALRDSPVGLAAYLMEKYSIFTNPHWKNLDDAGLTQKFKLEDLLDNVMIYWVTGCITSSMRIYAESFNERYNSLKLPQIPTPVPSGCARFSHEVVYQPETVLRQKFPNLVHLADYEGGHFAAAEEPKILAKDLYLFVEKVEKISGDNKGTR